MRQVCLLLLLVATMGCGGGELAPNLTLERVGEPGKKFDLNGFRGKVVLLDFWATWCGPCRENMPHIAELHRKYASQGLETIALSDETGEQVGAFAKDLGLDVPLYLDSTGGKATEIYNVEAIPYTVVIDREGKIVFKGHPEDMAVIEAAIKRAL